MKLEYTVAHLFGGIGGGSQGFENARGEFMGKLARFRTLCSVDSDPIACENYENITGNKAVQMDLFSKEQYIDFHGEEPPSSWSEVKSSDLLHACNGEYPDVIFTSPPCKGFSGLLPSKSANTNKYQALNKLTLRGIRLCLDAFSEDLPSLILLENVPRITTRGKKLLEEIKGLLVKAGYAVSDGFHDCGEIGGLGQKRKRYLMIARYIPKMNSFVYQPSKKPHKTIGDVIGDLPFPGDIENGGKMHRLPKLQRKTWERLACISAGGDWRDLEKIEYEKYQLKYQPRAGAWAIEKWEKPSRTITCKSGIGQSNGVTAVADPR